MTRPEITQMSLTDISMPAADTVTAAEPDLTAELDDLLARGRIDADYHARRRAQLLSGDF